MSSRQEYVGPLLGFVVCSYINRLPRVFRIMAFVRSLSDCLRVEYRESAQPYQRGNGDAARLDPIRDSLSLLHELSRIDKHRRIHTDALFIRPESIEIQTADVAYIIVKSDAPPQTQALHAFRGGPVRVGPSEGEAEMDVNLNIRMAIAFAEAPFFGRHVLRSLREIDTAVTAVLTELSRP